MRKPRRVSAGEIVSLLSFACSWLLVLFAVDVAGTAVADDGAGLRPTAIAVMGASRIVAYETNCGAPCDYGLLVRKEVTVLPGVVATTTLYSQYHARGADLRLVDAHHVRVLMRWDDVYVPGPVISTAAPVLRIERPVLE